MIKGNLLALVVSILLTLTSLSTFSQFKVVGYVQNWDVNPKTIRYNLVTHINFAFAEMYTNGNIKWLSKNDTTNLKEMRDSAHKHNVKVLVSFGGYGHLDISTVAGSPVTRTNFASNLTNMVNHFNLDGVDIDWEFPDVSKKEDSTCVLIMKEISDSLHKYNKLVTMAVNWSGGTADAIKTEIFDYVDWLTIMAYDAGTPHSSYGIASSALDYWLGRGLPKEKTILGVPFYGHTENTTHTYSEIVASDGLAPYKDESTIYEAQVNAKVSVNYNGLATIKAKTSLAKTEGGGIMIWDIMMDTNNKSTSLLEAVNSKLTAIEEEKLDQSLVTIYPNPASNLITLSFENQIQNPATITLTDLSGKALVKFENVDPTLNTNIDVNGLPDGFYFLKIKSGDKALVKKIIIKK